MEEEINSTLEEFREWVVQHFPAEAGWDRNHKSSLLSGMRETLLTIADVLAVKVPALYHSTRPGDMRPDRNCSVEVALLDDLLTLDRFAHDFLERPFSFGCKHAARITAALVWPLNAAIAGPLATAQSLPIGRLLAGPPDGLAADFSSYRYQQLVDTCQDAFRQMLCAQLRAVRKTIGNSGSKMVVVGQLLNVLDHCLHLDKDCLARSMEAVSQLDVSVREDDQNYFSGLPVYASWRRQGSPALTTYASLLLHTLEQVDLAVSVHISLQPRIGVTSRSIHLTPEVGGTPLINVTPSTNTTPLRSGTPRISLTPSYRTPPIHLPSHQRDSAAVGAACHACKEVINHGLAEWRRLNSPTAAPSLAHPSWSRKSTRLNSSHV